MKLFVDDIRKPPEGWQVARTITDAIRILATQEVEEISLDHDIACRLVMGQEHSSEETFEPVARYLALMPAERRPKISIHTANPGAGQVMAKILGIYYSWGFMDG